ncbi:hypothetical protein [Aporhodopirellula aestuarii]|uniref:hypothetical protein n=1 Tax=Aporhodopirellula aestuarii TaxID=2950107 RepID=UPI0020342640|nr:hypothetical protein [Aporhodopirellula aestuarii]
MPLVHNVGSEEKEANRDGEATVMLRFILFNLPIEMQQDKEAKPVKPIPFGIVNDDQTIICDQALVG